VNRTGPVGRPVAPVLGVAWLLVFGTLACVPQPAGRATPPAGTTPGSSADARTPTPGPTVAGPSPSLTFSRPTATPLPTFFAYRVRTGDTLTSIARQFETTPQSLGYWNRDAYPSLDPDSPTYDPNTIRVGWTLRVIPGGEVDEQELTPPPAMPAG
jgi:Tfp pilus assembly protein FimV